MKTATGESLMKWLPIPLRKAVTPAKSLSRLMMVSVACGACLSATAAPAIHQPLTVADAIETARFQENRQGKSVFVSPDGTRYVSMVVRGNIKSDGVWMDVLSGSLSSLDAAKP